MDDSVDPNGVFVLAGYVATEEAWREFSLEWQKLARRFGRVDEKGRWYFHMAEMKSTLLPEGRAAFFRAIENHVSFGLSASIHQNHLRHVFERIRVPYAKLDWGLWKNPYFVCFRVLMDMFHTRRADMSGIVQAGDRIDFFFDEHGEEKQIREAWDEYVEKKPEPFRSDFSSAPRFEDDKDFLPLQAADFWAWWVREWTAAGTPEKADDPFIGEIAVKRQKFPKVLISYNEEQLMESYFKLIRENAGGVTGLVTYDLGPLAGRGLGI